LDLTTTNGILNTIKEYTVKHIKRVSCDVKIPIDVILDWLATLDDEGVIFIKKVILPSGSLKEISKILISQYKK
jgi:hypothetical protein